MDTVIIENIPLSTDGREDFWAWHYERSGIFSVRSAYRMMVSDKATTTWLDYIAGRSDARSEEKEWVDLWRVKLPPKIRMFLWRLACHSIPTGDIRHRRNMARTTSVVFAGRWTHGGILYLTAVCRDALGSWNTRISGTCWPIISMLTPEVGLPM